MSMAAGYALGAGRPALVLLHSTPGLGNAVAALATARLNRAPLVVIVGQQDRRHLALDPFLAGRLHGLAGEYPVFDRAAGARPGRPGRDRPRPPRGRHRRGPALVIVPMDDWTARAPGAARDRRPAAAAALRRGRPSAPSPRSRASSIAPVRPAIIAGAGDSSDGWPALIALARSSTARSSRSRSAAPRASRRTIRCSPATRPRGATSSGTCLSRAHDASSSSAPGRCASTRTTRGPLIEPGTAPRGDHR